ncbi:KLRBC protein, partial [Motacilla alba]|nr:KLRBC protein [Motacilla alba]
LYADLRFAKVMGGRSMASQALEAAFGMNEAESPYESTQPALAGQDGDGAEPSPGCWSRRWCVPVGLLTTCLLLVATVALGACCELGDSEHLQQAVVGSGRHLAGVGMWVNRGMFMHTLLSPRALSATSWPVSLTHPSHLLCLPSSLFLTLLSISPPFLSHPGIIQPHITAPSLPLTCSVPLPTDCCPSGWLLYRGKCLFISSEKKTWEDSRDECEKTYSQLLVTKSWSRWTVPTFLKNADVPYWIGLQKGSFPWYDYGWLEEEDPESQGDAEAWFWVDGSLYERPWQSKSNGTCAIISRGSIKPAQCTGPSDLHLWICEKAAGSSFPF